MKDIFPKVVKKLPRADIPFDNIEAYLFQGENHQILFMKFNENVQIPEHTHGAQWGIVLNGEIELNIGGKVRIYKKGDNYFIPKSISHSAKITSGYADITLFEEKDRYKKKL